MKNLNSDNMNQYSRFKWFLASIVIGILALLLTIGYVPEQHIIGAVLAEIAAWCLFVIWLM